MKKWIYIAIYVVGIAIIFFPGGFINPLQTWIFFIQEVNIAFQVQLLWNKANC